MYFFNFLASFIDRWLGGMVEPAIIFAGIFLCLFTVTAYWERKLTPKNALILLILGLIAVCCKLIFSWLVELGVGETAVRVSIFTWATITVVFLYQTLGRKNIQQSKNELDHFVSPHHTLGVKAATVLIIGFICLSTIFVAMLAPQVMIGDEVTHYYMLTTQAEDLSKPNFYADIPLNNGEIERRRYPHSFLWHYLGAVVYKISGNSFLAVQLYHTMFFLQFLAVGYLLARSRFSGSSVSPLLFVTSLASLPLCLIFSVALYQDVPMAAQILSGFYLLSREKYIFASFFMAFALCLKVTAVLFFPAFFLLLFIQLIREQCCVKGGLVFIVTITLVMGTSWGLAKALSTYAQATFYPQKRLELLVDRVHERFPHLNLRDFFPSKDEPVRISKGNSVKNNTGREKQIQTDSEGDFKKAVIIANHPGDLRVKENYIIYGGGLVWLLFVLGCFGCLPFPSKGEQKLERPSSLWLWFTSLSFLVITAYFSRTAPDVRFFLPGLPFLLLPVVERVSTLPRAKFLTIFIVSLSILQSGYVLARVYNLRAITPATKEAIEYLEENKPQPPKIFMYPEGNYRYFSVDHEWYLGYRLREFWRADNTKRMQMLRDNGVGAIVIKKHLISKVDEKITNLGVYPDFFVRSIKSDPQFLQVFDNREMSIYVWNQLVQDNL